MTNAVNTVIRSSTRLRVVKSRIDNIFLIFLNLWRVNYALRHAGNNGFLGGVSILAARNGCKPRYSRVRDQSRKTKAFSISHLTFFIRRFNFEVQRRNPEGCEKVAGGRREAKTTGWGRREDRTPTGCQMRSVCKILFSHPLGVQLFSDLFRWFSLRCNHRLLSASPPGLMPASNYRTVALRS